MSIDTLTLAQRLRAAELPADHAEAIAAAIGSAVLDGAATKDDLAATKFELKAEMGEIRAEIGEVRAELMRAETRVEAKLEALHARLSTWFIGSQVAVGALIVALVKL